MQKISAVKTYQVYLIFTVSGATALVYQVIWSRWLGLIFGNTTTSVSIVLGSFMLGLALGSWLAGRYLYRVENPLRVYAYMEFGIGLFALCFPLLTRFTDHLFTLAVTPESPAAFSLSVKAALSFVLLLFPTTLMGATLPLLTDFFRRSPRHTQSWKVGLLYAANTLGAALGIVTAGFLLIELIGVFSTTVTAAALNCGIAVLAFRLSSSTGVLPGREQNPAGSARSDAMGRLALVVLTVSGGIALASEVLWTRTIETLVGNSTYAFSMIVLLYLAGIAAGSWLMSLLVNRLKRLPFWLASLLLAMGIWTFVALFLFDGLVRSVSVYKAVPMPLALLLWNYIRVMALLLPLSLLSGACFPLATRIIDPASEDAKGALIARAYAWNTAGAVAGSLLAGFVIAPRFDYLNSLYLLALLYGCAAFAAYLMMARSEGRAFRAGLAAAGALSVALIGASLSNIAGESAFGARTMGRSAFRIVYHKPGLQGITTVLQHRNRPLAEMLLVNGMGMTVKVTDTKMMAHLPMLAHPDPQDTLVICFGMGTTYRSAVSHGGRVTVIELVGEVLETFDYFHGDAPRVRAYPKGRMLVNDGRSFLKTTREKYDVITIDPPPPIDAAGVNHLYSREFIDLAKTHLKKGGIMAHWLPFPGTQSGLDDMETFNMLLKSFTDVFPYVHVLRGYNKIGLHVLGSMEPFTGSLELLKARLANKAVLDDVREWDPVSLDYFQGLQPLPRGTVSGEPVTDDRPRLEFYLLRTWKNSGKKTFVFNFW